MSIDSEVTSMTQNIQADYEGLVNLGVDLTGVNKNIQNIRTCLDTVYSNLPKVSNEGTELTLTPTLKGKLGIVEKGNSIQEPLDNLFNINDDLSLNRATLLADDFIKIGFDNTEGSSVAYCSAFTNNLDLQPNKKYKIVAEIKEISGRGTIYVTNRNTANNRGQFPNNAYSITTLSAGQKLIFDAITIEDFTGTTRGLNTTMNISTGVSGFVTLRLSVLEDLSITEDTFYYCPYGATSPTPSFPFPIRNVTGNNNVVVKNNDNTESQTLPLNLGTIELNKIGNYQDYIYKSGDKWYKHEVIKKIVLDGSENVWTYDSTNNYFQYGGALGAINSAGGYMNLYKYVSSGLGSNNNSFTMTTNNLRIQDDAHTTVTDYCNWLSTNNAILYYVKATATDIEITDITLIEQLEDIDKMQGYNGTTIITSTYDNSNAQMIINASGLKGE